LTPGFKVDTNDARYKALRDLASRENLSQPAFSEILGVEARRINSEYDRARSAPPAPTPAPAASGVPANWDKLSTTEKFHRALQQSAAKPRGS
jgi:hypothetical protein